MIILKTRSEVKVKVRVTTKWYVTLRHPKMYPHTKFGIPTSKNIGDMDRTRKRDGLTDRRTDSVITICLPKFLWGHKNRIAQCLYFVKCIAGNRLNLFCVKTIKAKLSALSSSSR